MDDLLLARIEERHIHFVGRDGVDMQGLHEANVLQTSDIVRAAQLGLVVGGASGAVIGLTEAFFPLIGGSPQWTVAAVLAMVGAPLGAWTASLVGASVPSHRLARFRPAIDAGQLLLMVDVPRARVEEIEDLLAAQHPEAHLEGLEPNIPAFP
jgi:hypothetical protein